MLDHIMLFSSFHITGAQPFFIDTFFLLEFYWKPTMYQAFEGKFRKLVVSYVMFNLNFRSFRLITFYMSTTWAKQRRHVLKSLARLGIAVFTKFPARYVLLKFMKGDDESFFNPWESSGFYREGTHYYSFISIPIWSVWEKLLSWVTK